MRYNQTDLKWGVTSADKLVAAFDDQNSATAFKQTLEERGQHDDLQVYDFENDQIVSELEPAGDRIEG